MLDFLIKRDPQIMGIVNVTPDSFSDGGRFDSHESAIAQGRRLAADGAHIVDVGGESTRPGAESISVRSEIERVVPVISTLSDEGITVSVDTSKPEVMEAAVAAGASMVNDIYALRQAGALDMAARLGVPVCLMHMQGTPTTMQKAPYYDNIGKEIGEFLSSRIDTCLKAGIDRNRLLVDPGIGFGKTTAHNLEIMGRLDELVATGWPVVLGVSRKRFLGDLMAWSDLGNTVGPVDGHLDPTAPDDRREASVALATWAFHLGVSVVRAHDVRSTFQAARVVGSPGSRAR